MDLLPAYRELLCSPAQLAHYAQAGSVAALLQALRQLWPQAPAGDGELVAALNRCNQQVLDLDPRRLEGRWFPHAYHAASRSLGWCLAQGHATEPFQEQFIARCRQQVVLNQFIQPRVAVAPLLATPAPCAGSGAAPAAASGPVPAGFIFHLSRCGSTLVSGSLAELDDTTVLSESPALTAALLDPSLDAPQKRHLLGWLVRLQAAAFPGRGKVIIKWNAWDLLAWPLIEAAFPGVPTLLLVRDPEEILASHAGEAGRHMSGDPSLAALGPAFGPMAAGQTPLDRRIDVLAALMQAMAGVAGAGGARLFDYTQLDAGGLARVRRHFGLDAGEEAQARIARRMARHSKLPERAFAPDAARKRECFDADGRQRIHARLGPAYRALLDARAPAPPAGLPA